MSETNTLAPEAQPETETVRISLLVTRELRVELEKRAATERRSLNGQCVLFIEKGMQQADSASAAA